MDKQDKKKLSTLVYKDDNDQTKVIKGYLVSYDPRNPFVVLDVINKVTNTKTMTLHIPTSRVLKIKEQDKNEVV